MFNQMSDHSFRRSSATCNKPNVRNLANYQKNINIEKCENVIFGNLLSTNNNKHGLDKYKNNIAVHVRIVITK